MSAGDTRDVPIHTDARSTQRSLQLLPALAPASLSEHPNASRATMRMLGTVCRMLVGIARPIRRPNRSVTSVAEIITNDQPQQDERPRLGEKAC